MDISINPPCTTTQSTGTQGLMIGSRLQLLILNRYIVHDIHYGFSLREPHFSACMYIFVYSGHLKYTAFSLLRKDLDLDAEAPPFKKTRTEGEDETDFSMASLARGVVTEVREVGIPPRFIRILLVSCRLAL